MSSTIDETPIAPSPASPPPSEQGSLSEEEYLGLNLEEFNDEMSDFRGGHFEDYYEDFFHFLARVCSGPIDPVDEDFPEITKNKETEEMARVMFIEAIFNDLDLGINDGQALFCLDLATELVSDPDVKKTVSALAEMMYLNIGSLEHPSERPEAVSDARRSYYSTLKDYRETIDEPINVSGFRFHRTDDPLEEGDYDLDDEETDEETTDEETEEEEEIQQPPTKRQRNC